MWSISTIYQGHYKCHQMEIGSYGQQIGPGDCFGLSLYFLRDVIIARFYWYVEYQSKILNANQRFFWE